MKRPVRNSVGRASARRSALVAAALLGAAGAVWTAPPGFGVRFEDVTQPAGIRFRHERAASKEKLYLETIKG